ncbi:MAG: capsule biosynthesis protein [Pseudomonadota bacterium]
MGSQPGDAAQPSQSATAGKDDAMFTHRTEDGFGDAPFPGSAASGKPKEDPAKVQADLDAIAGEKLTGRQLRMARRLAAKNGLTPTSDFDAVRLLRRMGIDPFERSSLLELVVPEQKSGEARPGADAGAAAAAAPAAAAGAAPAAPQGRQTLPQKIDPVQIPAPAGQPADIAARRAAEISAMQADISRRRRGKLIALFARLTVFILLPTVLAGIYYGMIATKMYATKSEFVIQQADSQQGGMGGLLGGTGFATSQDSIVVQGYLQSRQALLRLNEDHGFIEHFSSDEIDFINRLDADSTNEDAYKLYKKQVTIGYDPADGVIRMEVAAASPEKSQEFSQALINYAEEQVDDLTQRLREDQMRGATESFADAETKMVAAQTKVLELQQQLGVLDPVSETSGLMTQITQFEVQLAEKRLQREQLLDNRQPNQARVSGVEGDIERLEGLISDLRGQMTSTTGTGSLASISSQLSIAQVDLETRTLMMQESLQALEASRIEANRQVRYLSVSASPVPPDEPTYPKFFENTLLALLVFSGIYLLVSLTVSILREQVSS